MSASQRCREKTKEIQKVPHMTRTQQSIRNYLMFDIQNCGPMRFQNGQIWHNTTEIETARKISNLDIFI